MKKILVLLTVSLVTLTTIASFTSALSGNRLMKICWDIDPNGTLEYLKINGNTVLGELNGKGSIGSTLSIDSTFTSEARFVANSGYYVSVHDAYYDPTIDEFIVRGRFVDAEY